MTDLAPVAIRDSLRAARPPAGLRSAATVGACLIAMVAHGCGAATPPVEREATASGEIAVSACDRFAAPDGSDSAPGTFRRPLRSPDALARALAPGETGCLRGGTYSAPTSPYVLALSAGGRPGAFLTLTSFPGERARLRGIVQVESSAAWVRLSRLDFEGTGRANAVKVYGDRVSLEDNLFTTVGRPGSCLILGGAPPLEARRPMVVRNVFQRCGSKSNLIPGTGNAYDHAIYATNVVGGMVLENLIWGAAGKAIQLGPSSRDTLVAHNVIDARGAIRGAGVVLFGDSSGNRIDHNVIAGGELFGIYSTDMRPTAEGNVARANCVSDAGRKSIGAGDALEAVGNLEAEPGFVDRQSRDYRLGDDSPCLALVGHAASAATRRSAG